MKEMNNQVSKKIDKKIDKETNDKNNQGLNGAPRNIIPEEIPVPAGTHHTTHNAFNSGGQSSSSINSGGETIKGRTSNTSGHLQARKIERADSREKNRLGE